jgi:hypothetical protein
LLPAYVEHRTLEGKGLPEALIEATNRIKVIGNEAIAYG